MCSAVERSLAFGIVSIVFFATASTAGAQGMTTPFVGTTFGAEATSGKRIYGLGVAARVSTFVGVEFELGYAPEFFDNAPEPDSVLTLGGNLFVGVPVRLIRPYGTVGMGLIRQRRPSGLGGLLDDITDNEIGWNAGAGLFVRVARSLSLRADLRRFQVRKSGGFGFSRAYIGLTLG